MVHKEHFTKPELLKVPGSLANTKEVFCLNQVTIPNIPGIFLIQKYNFQASKDCKNFEASWQHMELSADIIFYTLAEEAMFELNITSSEATKEDFENIVKAVIKKVKVAPRETEEEVTEADRQEDSDELRSFFLGIRSPNFILMSHLYSYL